MKTWLGVVEGIVCVLEVTVELKETGPQVKMGLILEIVKIVMPAISRTLNQDRLYPLVPDCRDEKVLALSQKVVVLLFYVLLVKST